LSVLWGLAALAALTLVASWFGADRVLHGNGRIPLTVRPENYGAPYEKVEFTTQDGVTLRGWFLPAAEPSTRTILYCHGWGANKGQVLEFTHGLRERGFNGLYFDFRYCGESDGELLSVGTFEAKDFDAAAAFLKKLRPRDSLGVYGLSMGAMVSFAGVARHPEFKAAALESGFVSHYQAVRRYLTLGVGLPYFPIVPLFLFWMKQRIGVEPELYSPSRVAQGWPGAPVLAIYGELDAMAPPEHGREFVSFIQAPATLWVVPGAGHGKCAQTAGTEYENRLADFFSAHL
jgi:uncharacterized protein